MARVDHRFVKKRLNEQRSKITDRQFFTSRLLAGHFEDVAAAQTRRYHYNRRVHVNLYWKPREESVASTNNMHIRINAGNPLVTKVKGRQERYQVVCGLFAHELGHVLYTDFLAAQTHGNYLAEGRWYPCKPELKAASDRRRERAFWEYARKDPRNLELVQRMAHLISNVVEDGYIESRILNDYPGVLGYGLEAMRGRVFDKIPTVTQLIEQEEGGEHHIFESILQILLSYTLYGEIKYGDTPLEDERIRTVFGLIMEIDRGLMSRSSKDRFDVVNLILIRCWDYIEGFLEFCKERQEEPGEAGSASDLAEMVSAALASVAGGTEIGTGSSTPVEETGEGTEPPAAAGARAKTLEDAQKSMEEPEDADQEVTEEEKQEPSAEEPEEPPTEGAEGVSEEETEGIPTKEPEKLPSEETGELPVPGEDMRIPDSQMTSPGKTEVSEREEGRLPQQQTETVSEPAGGITSVNEAYEREWYDRAAKDIERILDRMAEKAACEQLENERLQELNDMAQNISYGDIHSGVSIHINRIASVDEQLVEQYEVIAAPLTDISRQMQKSLVKELEESRRRGKQTGLMMGRRLDAHALCRNDGRVFYKNSLPNEIPQMAVCLLLDESGSMRSRDRCSYARASAVILYDFCRGLGIPVMVCGHSTGYGAVQIYSYAEFESYDQDDRYRLMDIGARCDNRDGAALRYAAERLSGRAEEIKLLILVSDGQPADSGYYGTAAEEDLRGIKQEYQRKRILFVAAAIGDDKQDIERIYGDSFLDITDLSQLPVKLTNIVKRHIRI